MSLQNDFKELLEDALEETGVEVEKNLDEVSEYAAARAQHLSTIVGEPGFMQAVRAERDNVAIEAGLATVDTAEAVDARIRGVLQGALSIGAKFLAAAI